MQTTNVIIFQKGAKMTKKGKTLLVLAGLMLALLACAFGTVGEPAASAQATPTGDLVGTFVAGTQTAAAEQMPTETPYPTSVLEVTSAAPRSTATVVAIGTVTPEATICNSHFSTYKVDIEGTQFTFGSWDSDLALATWPGVGSGLAWAQFRGICSLDFVYDKPIDHSFVIVHAEEAEYPAVQELYSTIDAKVMIWVYLSENNTEVMCYAEHQGLEFVRWQLYNKDGWEIPAELACP